MLYYALVFFLVAIVSAVLGFTGLAEGFADVAKALVLLFILLAVLSLLFGAFTGRKPPLPPAA